MEKPLKQINKKHFVTLRSQQIKGNSNSMSSYATMILTGDGIKAVDFLKKAIEKGNSHAIYNYVIMLLQGDEIEVNKREGISYLNNSNATNICATMLLNGDGVPIDNPKINEVK